MKKINIFIYVLMTLSFFILTLKADQNNPKLDELFKNIQDTNSENEMAMLTSKIWEIWYEATDNDTQILFDRGADLLENNLYEQSLTMFNNVVSESPDFAEGWNKRATVHFLMGNYDKSIKDIDRTLSLEPRHFGALDGLGLIYYELENYSEAIRVYQRLLVIMPHSSNAKRMLETINDKFV